jgi:hypothetical protein
LRIMSNCFRIFLFLKSELHKMGKQVYITLGTDGVDYSAAQFGDGTMGTIKILLIGPPYAEPRYYGKLEWNDRNVYIRHPGGGKDSRHQDGMTYFKSPGKAPSIEVRVRTSDVSRELVNYVTLPSSLPEPPAFRGKIRPDDLILDTSLVGTEPRLAVEVVENARRDGVLREWESHSTAPSVRTYVDKGLGQCLIVAVASPLGTCPSTGGEF